MANLSFHNKSRWFPPAEYASPEGLLAIGGDLSSERLLEAYRLGIFPWYSEGQPILWWSPDPRAVLYPHRLHISRSLKKTLRQGKFQVSMDTSFEHVIRACAAPRSGDPTGGTWITADMINAYLRLHELGYAHSVETWMDGRLVGGLYGISLGRGFFGESMFSAAADASKVALVRLVERLRDWRFAFVDCQIPSAHVLSLGAEPIPRSCFLSELAAAIEHPDLVGPWRSTEQGQSG